MPSPSRSTLMMPEVGAVVLVPLDDDAAGHRRRLERHDLVEPPRRDHHAAGVLARGGAAGSGSRIQSAHEVLRRAARSGRSRPRRAAAGSSRASSRSSPKFQLRRAASTSRVDLLGRVAERLADLARGRAVAVGDDVRGHRRAARAVPLVDVLDDLLALVAGGQVEVDVRPLAALLGEEALEEQLHLHRIDGGDAERVADGAVGRRAAALHEDLLALAELRRCPRRSGSSRRGRASRSASSSFSICACALRGQRPEAGARAVPGDLAQKRGRRLAGRQRVVGEAVAEVGEREVERSATAPRAPRAPRAGRAKSRTSPPAPCKCRSRCAASSAAGARRAVVCRRIAGQDVVQRLVARRARSARRSVATSGSRSVRREVDERAVARAPRRGGDGAGARRGGGPGRGVASRARSSARAASEPPRRERASDRSLFPAGQAVQALRVRGDVVPRDPPLPLRPVDIAPVEISRQRFLYPTRFSTRRVRRGRFVFSFVSRVPCPVSRPSSSRRTSAPTSALTPAAFAAL